MFGLGMILVGSTTRYIVMSDFLREDITTVVSQQQMSLANYVANDIGHKILIRQYRLQELGSQITPDIIYGSALPDSYFAKSAPSRPCSRQGCCSPAPKAASSTT
ncbi:hypothetical protein [Neopusillimonas aromaticivorans]|uniref:hypothetical protein n=1 Tax=Neopusillimonas aromaticivorans TaxID=2979868 RepID=UPI0025927CF5|nr:hypothetical protein [Neopusillimonas aromaticivorans]WJJ94621.1 hypothetical protein N7E01_06735 [Neopusillimonas aromaticivorans]